MSYENFFTFCCSETALFTVQLQKLAIFTLSVSSLLK